MSEDKKKKEPKYLPMIYICLLLTQLKYDSTGEIVSPLEMIKIRINDFNTKEGLKKELVNTVNSTIKKLNLNEKFLV